MIRCKNFLRTIALMVIFTFLFQSELFMYSATVDELNHQFLKAKNEYINGQYIGSKNRLERLIGIINEEGLDRKDILGKCYILLGMIYEKEEKVLLAEENYRKAMDVYGVQAIDGVDLQSFPIYIKVVIGEKKQKKKIIEKASKKKRRKKFPWLFVIGGAFVVSVVVMLLFKKKPKYYILQIGEMKIQLVRIPAGEFQMGDNFNEGSSDEQPVHKVYLDEYYISKYEITLEIYDYFCEKTGREESYDRGWGRDNRPVIWISWESAKAFCDWVSEETGKNIHLPTEAQWEKAARGDDQRRYPWGNDSPSCNITNYIDCQGKTMPVGSYPNGVSPYGVHDMTGNAYEWCQDYYSSSYYSNSPYKNPQGPSSGYYRAIRGGDFQSDESGIRSAYRRSYPPAWEAHYIGFRIVMEK